MEQISSLFNTAVAIFSRYICCQKKETRNTIVYALTHVTRVLYRDIVNASSRKGAPVIMPNAQIKGSACCVTVRSFLAERVPIATPEKPAKHVMTPNIKLTLQYSDLAYKYNCQHQVHKQCRNLFNTKKSLDKESTPLE